MSDDLFKDCDCDCGDCNCDCNFDCCDCDCDDCLPGNNAIIVCCCIPPTNANNANRTNRADAPPDCCCFCCNPRRRGRERRNKKYGFCCWRLWCCFALKDPSPPPRHPAPEDLDLYMNNRWARHHHELDTPPMGYKSRVKYPIPGEMRMYRDEYYGSGGRYGMHKELDARSKDYYHRRGGWDEREARGMDSKPGMNEVDTPSRWAKTDDLGKAVKDERNDEENTRRVLQDAHRRSYHGSAHKQDNSDKLEIGPFDYGSDDNDDVPNQDRVFQSRWSTPVKYEESGRQTKH